MRRKSIQSPQAAHDERRQNQDMLRNAVTCVRLFDTAASHTYVRAAYFAAVCAFSRSIAFCACAASGPCGRIFK